MKNNLDIQQIKEHALNKGGKCLSNHFENGKRKLLWQCKKGHQWKSSIQSVLGSGSWCPVCAKNQAYTMEDMQSLAKDNEGRCLSKDYVNVKTKLIWKCKNDHVWESTADNIKQGRCCPHCNKTKKGTENDSNNFKKMSDLAYRNISTDFSNHILLCQ